MNPELKQQWVKALRSGEYKQGIGVLRSMDDHFCCLGVLCDVVNPEGWASPEGHVIRRPHDGEPNYPSSDVLKAAGMHHYVSSHLEFFNDELSWSFDHIADWIEANL